MISGLVGDELIRKTNQRAKWFEVGLILGRPLLFLAPQKLKAEKNKAHLPRRPAERDELLHQTERSANNLR